MDGTTAGFYAAICGALAGCAPFLGTWWIRIVVGAIVGVGASYILPAIRGMIGLY